MQARARTGSWLRARLSARLGPLVSAAITSPWLRDLSRHRFEARRKRQKRPHEVIYFHQADDPYSALTPQVLAALVSRYDIQLTTHLVPPPEDWAAPERERLDAYGLRDAKAIAPAYGLAFDPEAQPTHDEVSRAQAILCSARSHDRFVEALAVVSHALWSGQILTSVAAKFGEAKPGHVREALKTGADLRCRNGHYLGATFLHAGEWYWGLDRLQDLEIRLKDLGLDRLPEGSRPIAPRPSLQFASADPAPADTPPLEVFLSLRSPYSWLAIDRARALADQYGLKLVLRPLLPMVMRGLPVPQAKRLYIVRDCKREAERLGLPFGRICDPVGAPVERGLAVLAGARQSGRDAAFAASFLKGVFAEGVDAGSDRGLKQLCARAGIGWSEALDWMADDQWREEAETHRQEMLALSLWGVPSFRFGDHSTWGQDRLWLIEDAILQTLNAGDQT